MSTTPPFAPCNAARRRQTEISQLVQKRVEERNAWLVNGKTVTPITFRDSLVFMRDSLPKMLRFKVDEDHLDEVFPVLSMDWDRIKQQTSSASLSTQDTPSSIQLTWLGHSSILVQMGGCNIVTDPVFSERCSPSQWFGPKRYRKAPCSVQELCQHVAIDLVLISHNHYDHLDHQSVVDFAKHSKARFVVPLGLGDWFRKHVDKSMELYEVDWHEIVEFGDSIQVTSLPMRHWSNRVGDRDKTLWCGYGIEAKGSGPSRRFLFPGDTAWFDDLQQLGEQYGPYDVAALPIGAYEPRDFMKHNHTDVQEAVQMKDAMRATYAVPIHWGTFPLTVEPAMEPRAKLQELMAARKDSSSFVAWQIGETKSF